MRFDIHIGNFLLSGFITALIVLPGCTKPLTPQARLLLKESYSLYQARACTVQSSYARGDLVSNDEQR